MHVIILMEKNSNAEMLPAFDERGDFKNKKGDLILDGNISRDCQTLVHNRVIF